MQVPQPTVVASVASQLQGGIQEHLKYVTEESKDSGERIKGGSLKTTVKNPDAIERDKLNYLHGYYGADQHVPGVCPCEQCVAKQQELMAWALSVAHEQHSQAMAQAISAAEEAQRTGQGPKPMMVTPYKHNWIISGGHAEGADEEKYVSFRFILCNSRRLIDWEGIASDLDNFLKERVKPQPNCCAIASPTDTCRMM